MTSCLKPPLVNLSKKYRRFLASILLLAAKYGKDMPGRYDEGSEAR